jgi:hypothetical protein
MNDAAGGDAAVRSRAAGADDLATIPIDEVLARLEVAADKGLDEDAVRNGWLATDRTRSLSTRSAWAGKSCIISPARSPT